MVNLTPLIDHLPAWLMVLFRLTGIFLLAPVFGSRTIPRIVKVFMIVGLSLCVYPMLMAKGHTASASLAGIIGTDASGMLTLSLWNLLPIVAIELLMGYVIGYCASLPLIGMQIGGQVIDQQMGISAGGVFNPDLDAEAGVMGQLYFLAGLTVFLIIGGHHAILLTLVGSFELIPIGGFGTTGVEMSSAVGLVVGLLNVMFDMALRIAMPLLCILFLLRVAMGFIGRTVPQMNILSVGFIFYILAGALVLVVGATATMTVFRDTLQETLQQVLSIFTMN
ncbi:flagellar biosynthetic protein FliR [Algisphaera agarilytica]|uniref:Flagellar biosynthetic protein FliR n=1 Tax=Algisphaera agarilytica TaxID=1385975 RepID=A0A7X0LLC1_9BACT|nr:flagellar biosynthetic protein FliR [Algisphaera agarilytica]MBB6430754.1 flagellar biosynthetic protein FliR [Algisphaera agarilytica]